MKRIHPSIWVGVNCSNCDSSTWDWSTHFGKKSLLDTKIETARIEMYLIGAVVNNFDNCLTRVEQLSFLCWPLFLSFGNLRQLTISRLFQCLALGMEDIKKLSWNYSMIICLIDLYRIFQSSKNQNIKSQMQILFITCEKIKTELVVYFLANIFQLLTKTIWVIFSSKITFICLYSQTCILRPPLGP